MNAATAIAPVPVVSSGRVGEAASSASNLAVLSEVSDSEGADRVAATWGPAGICGAVHDVLSLAALFESVFEAAVYQIPAARPVVDLLHEQLNHLLQTGEELLERF